MLYCLVSLVPSLVIGESSALLATFGQTPDWAQPVEVEIAVAPSERGYDGGNVHQLLVSDQFRPDLSAVYSQRAYRFLVEAGVSDASTLTWRLDPDYESITLHKLVLHRNENIYDLSGKHTFRISDGAQDDGYNLYNNSVEARIILDDMRVGDVLEYAYTITGKNPVVGDRFSAWLVFDWPIPVDHFHYRIDQVDQRQLEFLSIGEAPQPRQFQENGVRSWVWEKKGQPALEYDDQTPSYYYASSRVQVSDWGSWEKVAAWAVDLYPLDAPLPESLVPEIERIQALSENPQQQALEALRFVQSQFRYVSVVMGPHSYQPYDPELIVERRYGDCKDKTLLLCILLRELGIKARPVIVHTGDLHTIADNLPSPGIFDHVTTRIYIGDRVFDVDPTMRFQGGELADNFIPRYGAGLLVDAVEGGLLRDLEGNGYEKSQTAITESFRIHDFAGGGQLDVVTVYEGRDADDIRASLAQSSLKDFERNYLNYYADMYRASEITAPLVVRDDLAANRIELVEAYKIEDAMELRDDGDNEYLDFFADIVYNHMRWPQDRFRSMPIGLYEPLRLRQTIRVELPDDSRMEKENQVISNEWFHFTYDVLQTGRILTLDFSYENRAREVAAAQTDEYVNALNRAHKLLDYQIVYTPPLAGSGDSFVPNKKLIWLSLLVAVVSIIIAVKIYRKDLGQAPGVAVNPELDGIGGWLILPAIGVCVSPIRQIIEFFEMKNLFDGDNWQILTNPESPHYIRYFDVVATLEILFAVGFIVFYVFLLISFFKKRRFVPLLYIVLFISYSTLTLADTWVVGQIPGLAEENEHPLTGYRDSIRNIIACFIWVSYFLRSERVKSTFRH